MTLLPLRQATWADSTPGRAEPLRPVAFSNISDDFTLSSAVLAFQLVVSAVVLRRRGTDAVNMQRLLVARQYRDLLILDAWCSKREATSDGERHRRAAPTS